MTEKTTVIAFHGGCYGTYLEWCLSTLTSSEDIQTPFNSNGNSHKFLGHHLGCIQGWRIYRNKPQHYQFVRLHPKTEVDHCIQTNLREIAEQADKIIYLCPDKSTLLLCLNNHFYKIWDNWFSQSLGITSDINKIYNNWPVTADTPVDQISTWILREFCSFYLTPMWLDQIGWNDVPCNHPKVMIVTVGQLLRDFETTLTKIQNFCDLNFIKPISELLLYHEQNLQLQKYLNHDQLCNHIIKSTIENFDFSWSPLSLPSESWIQWQLRNLGYEIRCNELDTFPTNSLQLKELLYSV